MTGRALLSRASWLGGASSLAGRSWPGGRAEDTGGPCNDGKSLLGEGSWPGRGSLKEAESLLDRDSGPGEGSWPAGESLLGGRSCPGGGPWPGQGSLLGWGSSAPGPFPSSKGISLFSSASDSNIWKTKRKRQRFRGGGYEWVGTMPQPVSQRWPEQNWAVARTPHPAPRTPLSESQSTRWKPESPFGIAV